MRLIVTPETRHQRRQAALHALLSDYVARTSRAPSFERVAFDCLKVTEGVAGAWDVAMNIALLGDEAQLAVQDSWPADVRASFEHLGYYDSYSPTTLDGTFAHLSSAGQEGLTNAVKGTDFEILATNRLNAGEIPGFDAADYHATLADSTTQPGWDAVVTDHAGHVVGHLQMKATAAAPIIAEHLHRYPDIPDVVTTQEGAQAAAHADLPGHITDSGISNAELDSHVHDVVQHIDVAHAAHEVLPATAIAVVLTTALRRLGRGEAWSEVGRWSTQRVWTSTRRHVEAHGTVLLTHNPHAAPVYLSGRLAYRLRVAPSGKVAPVMAERAQTLAALLTRTGRQPRPLLHIAPVPP